RSEEPIETDEEAAVVRLEGVADGFLIHDRPIIRRVDDSVVRVAAGGPVVLRLARGATPLPRPGLARGVEAPGGTPPRLLAVWGQQKSVVALWTGQQAVLSPHVGDLEGPETRTAFTRLIGDFADLYGCQIERLACDTHPDYFSTRWADGQNLSLIRVQHHH